MTEIARRDLILGGSASVLAAASGPAFAQAGPTRGGTIRMVAPEPTMLTGAFNSAGQIYQISGKLFDGLVSYDFDFNPKPQLALSWETSPNGLDLTLRLRPGVKWHDGQPFTSADLAYSAMQVWKTAHPRGRSIYANLDAVDTPDPLTGILRFSKPAPYVMNALAGIESQILPRHLYEGQDLQTNPRNTAPVGTGPFRFVEWKRGQYVTFERNPDYWDAPKPYADRLVIQFIPDPAARSAAFEAGEIDVGGSLPVAMADARRLSGLPFLELPERGDEALGAMAYLEFNLRRPPFNDVRVRRAVAHAIDRQFLLKNVWYGFGKPSTGPVSSAMKKFYAPVTAAYPYDPALAQTMLDEAGYKRGAGGIRFRITHDPLPGSDLYTGTADYLRAALARIGIAVEVRNADFPTFYRRVYSDNDFDSTNFSAFNLTDPTMGVQRFYWSKNILKGVAFSNGSGYANPEVDRLLEDAQVEIDPKKRYDLFARFQQIAMDDLPNLPLADLNYFSLLNRRVQNAIVSPFGIYDNFADVSLKG